MGAASTIEPWPRSRGGAKIQRSWSVFLWAPTSDPGSNFSFEIPWKPSHPYQWEREGYFSGMAEG